MFFDLRRDVNNIFDFPLVGYVDPLEELLDMRRRMIDVFDLHVPQTENALEGEPSEVGTEKGKEEGKEKEK
jgi:hypothetical protein